MPEDCMDIDKNSTIEAWQYLHDKARYAAYAESARIERERRERAERLAAEWAAYSKDKQESEQ